MYLETCRFSNSFDELAQRVPWENLRTRDFRKDPENPDKSECYQAEALIYEHLPVDALLGLVAYNEAVATELRAVVAELGLDLRVHCRPGWFF